MQLLAGMMAALVFLMAPPAYADDDAAKVLAGDDGAAAEEGAADDAAAEDGAAAEEGAADDAAADEDGAADDAAAEDGGEDAAAAEAAPAEEGPESPWKMGLIMSISALFIGGASAAIGIWVDRDKSRPVVFAYAMSVLIIAACGVGMVTGYLDEEETIKKRQDLERMLDMTYEIAMSSGDPELIALVEKEADTTVELPPPSEETEEDDTGDVDEEGDDAEGDDAEATDDGTGDEAGSGQ